MQFSRLDDMAARQSIDAMRVFREFVRVRRELDLLAGSLFWKRVGEYEYLAHKVGRAIQYIGTRSPATEAQLAAFTARKAQLKDRCQSLKQTVETSQRMNRAVHAGAVPTEIVQVLTAIEAHGLTAHSLVVGSVALYAFAQSSGVELVEGSTDGATARLVEATPTSMRVLIHATRDMPSNALSGFRQALAKFADVKEASPKASRWLDLVVGFSRPNVKRKRTRTLGTKTEAGSALRWTQTTYGRFEQVLARTPAFEQVVVGKAGKMAVMRTVDPAVFVMWGKAVHAAGGAAKAGALLDSTVRFTEEMIRSSMVTTRLDEADRAALSQQIQAMVDETTAADDGVQGRLAALALLTAC